MDDEAFAALQSRLRPVEATHDAGGRLQTIVAIPSLNLDSELVQAHADDMPGLESRSLFWALALRRPRMRMVLVTCMPIPPEVVDYQLGLIPDADDPRERLVLLSPEDPSPRPLAQKILERPELLAELRGAIGDPETAFIMPFNVRAWERDLALALGVPVYGADHRFEAFGTKTGSRDVFAASGVAHPPGANGVRTPAELGEAILALRAAQPGLDAVVVKLDDAVYGEGNRIVTLRDLPAPGTREEAAALDLRLRTMDQDYLRKLTAGGIVEEMVEGEIRSPSVQLRILPGGSPLVVATHDQVLGGELNQTFVGCRFPADPEYGSIIAREARKVGEHLAAAGVVGRIGIDFVVARRDGGWQPFAVEINMREGGTSHPFGALWLLTDGTFDADASRYFTPEGDERFYFATDRLGDPRHRGLGVQRFLEAVRESGLGWNPATRTGAVFHMLGQLEGHGRTGVTAIGDSPDNAHAIYLGVAGLLDELTK